MIVANVFHAGDGNLHPLVCYDGRKEGEAEKAEELSGPDHRRLPGRRRVDHRRARRRHRQEEAHAEDVRRGGPRRVPAAALLVRSRRAGEPGQADADAAAVRRGAGPVPAAPARGGGAGGAVLRPETVAGGGDAAARAASGRSGRSAAGRSRGSPRATRSRWRPAGWTGSSSTTSATSPRCSRRACRSRRRRRRSPSTASGSPGTRPTPAGRRSAGSWPPPTPVRCATATAACATSSSAPSVVLSDGTIAKSGGKVIKNVAGYDLAKLFAGSFGTLGLIATVSVRLHPLPEPRPRPSRMRFDDPDALLRQGARARAAPLEADCFDVVWQDGSRAHPARQFSRRRGRGGGGARRVSSVDVRTGTRCARCSARRRRRAEGLRAPDGSAGRDPRGRATRPSSRAPRSGSPGSRSRRRDLAERVAGGAPGALAARVHGARRRRAGRRPVAGRRSGQVVMERLKARFDPARIFRPGTFVGGL